MSAEAQTVPDHAASRARGGWLWISAGVLAALVVVQGAGLLDRPAFADMVAERSGYTVMTTRADSSSELVAVIDERNETLLVYTVENRRRVLLGARQSLPELFVRGRQAAGMPDRP